MQSSDIELYLLFDWMLIALSFSFIVGQHFIIPLLQQDIIRESKIFITCAWP